MIQRIQSIYIILVIACLGAMFFFPFATIGELVYDLNGAGGNDEFLPFPMAGIVIGLIALSIFSLFSFKVRNRQLVLGRISYLLILAMVVCVYLSISKLQEAEGVDMVSYGVSTYLPVVSLVIQFLANRAIKNDDELVKSLDRLR